MFGYLVWGSECCKCGGCGVLVGNVRVLLCFFEVGVSCVGGYCLGFWSYCRDGVERGGFGGVRGKVGCEGCGMIYLVV